MSVQPQGLQELDPESVRACFRASCRYVLRGVAAQVDASGGDATAAFVMLAVMCANLDHIDCDPELALRYARFSAPAPETERKPVSALAVTARLGLPRETVRRRLVDLVAAGRCVRADDGFHVPTRVFSAAERREPAMANLAAVRRLRRDLLAEAGDLSWPLRGQGAEAMEEGDDPPTRIVSRHAANFALDFIRPLVELTGGHEDALTYMAVVDATWRGPEPDDAAALPGLTIAQSIDRPTESVRRRTANLVERGLVARTEYGFVARRDPQLEPALASVGLVAVMALRDLFGRLAAHGIYLD